MVGAGAVVTHSVPANAIVVGNPAIITGYVGSTISDLKNEQKILNLDQKLISGAKIIEMNVHKDMRGSLMVSEFRKDLPFIPKRIFFVYDVPNSKIRGEHAHKTCEQVLVCIKGKVSAVIDNGNKRNQIELDSPNKGLYIPAMIWGTQYNYSDDAILLCYASKKYEDSDYIRNYSEYLEYKKTLK
jgi:dTDP-4-dehydrorhamnose 3,5-epimerase-like enzyme